MLIRIISLSINARRYFFFGEGLADVANVSEADKIKLNNKICSCWSES